MDICPTKNGLCASKNIFDWTTWPAPAGKLFQALYNESLFKAQPCTNTWFQKISPPAPRKVIENSKGDRGSQKPKLSKESIKLNWNFQRDGRIQTKQLSILWEAGGK